MFLCQIACIFCSPGALQYIQCILGTFNIDVNPSKSQYPLLMYLIYTSYKDKDVVKQRIIGR